MTEHVLSVMTAFSAGVEMDIDDLLKQATRDFYNDDNTGRPNQVWAHVPKDKKGQVLATLRRPDMTTGDDFFIWRCEREEEITALCTFLQYFPEVSYWGITKAG